MSGPALGRGRGGTRRRALSRKGEGFHEVYFYRGASFKLGGVHS